MVIQFVPSDQSRSLWPVLLRRFFGAAHLDIASAFFSDVKGIAELRGPGSPVVRVVVCARYPTSPTALRELRDGLGADVRVAKVQGGGNFHEKLYLARSADGSPVAGYLGSANWTQGGLHRNQEAGVLIDDQKLLEQLATHFERTFASATRLSDAHLVTLEDEHARQKAATPLRAKDRGRMRWRWKTASGYILKQNGLSERPFREDGDDYRERIGVGGRFTGGQTQREIYSTWENGQEMIVSYIAQRRDGRRDRLLYGRGIIRDLDPDLWRLPDKLRDWLVQAGRAEDAEFLARWPRIVWLDPVEFIAYTGDSAAWVWASDVFGWDKVSFQGGYRWLREDDEWRRANEALDRACERFGVGEVEMDGIWWNYNLGIDRDHAMYMSRPVIEELNRAPAG